MWKPFLLLIIGAAILQVQSKKRSNSMRTDATGIFRGEKERNNANQRILTFDSDQLQSSMSESANEEILNDEEPQDSSAEPKDSSAEPQNQTESSSQLLEEVVVEVAVTEATTNIDDVQNENENQNQTNEEESLLQDEQPKQNDEWGQFGGNRITSGKIRRNVRLKARTKIPPGAQRVTSQTGTIGKMVQAIGSLSGPMGSKQLRGVGGSREIARGEGMLMIENVKEVKVNGIEYFPPSHLLETRTVQSNQTASNHQIESGFSSTHKLGNYALMVGYHLKQNLLNTLGYIIVQPVLNIHRKLFMDLSNLKTAIQLDDVDVFRLIPYLPQIYNKRIGEQVQLLLDLLVEYLNSCKENCLNHRWKAQNFDLEPAFAFFIYNPIFNGIIDVKKGRTLNELQNLAAQLNEFPQSQNTGYASVIFSPVIVRVLESIHRGFECFSEEILGYLLYFYPFPLHDKEIDAAVNQLAMKFVSGSTDTSHCKIYFYHYNHLALKPIELLKAITDRILESFCPMYLKAPAKVIRKGLEEKLVVMNYRNIYQNKFVSMTDLGKLLNQIDLTNYPVEIIMAKERVKEFIQKILPYINYQEFPAYKFHDKEEALEAFLEFIQVKVPHAHITLQSSINAIKAHFQFVKGAKILTPEILVSSIDAWLAPDLNDDIIEEAFRLKLFVLDEGSEIRRILSRQQRKCSDVLQCFIKAVNVLRNDDIFGRRTALLNVPHCVMMRYLSFPKGNVNTSPKPNLFNLLEVITPHFYRREIVIAAQRIRDFISDGKDLLPDFNGEKFCTKHEALVAYLERATKNTNYPREVYDSMRAIIPSVAFKIRQVKQVNVRVVNEIAKAFLAPDNDEVTANQIVSVANFMAANEVVVDLILDKLNVQKCTDVPKCYNQIAELLNRQNFTQFLFPKFKPFSPELYVLNLGFDLDSMSVEKINRIVGSLVEYQPVENNELDAAIMYSTVTAHLVDPYFNTINCNDKQVFACFESLIQVLKQNLNSLDVRVSVYQYLLSPTICDRRYCQWISFVEKGSTVLSPVLEYMKFVIENLAYKSNNFHIQLAMEQLMQYISNTDLDSILNVLKLKQIPSDHDRFMMFVTLIMKSLNGDDPMLINCQNIMSFFSSNAYPRFLTLDNFKLMVRRLEKTTPPEVYCEMNNKLRYLSAQEESVGKLFRIIEVDCRTLESCVTSMEIYTASVNNTYVGTISDIVLPDQCYDLKCEWTKNRFEKNPQNKRKCKMSILESLTRFVQTSETEVPLIVKLLAESLYKDNRLSQLLYHVQFGDVDSILQQPDPLITFLEVILDRYYPPVDLRPSLRYFYWYLKKNELPKNLNHETLINLLQLLNRETRDDIVRTQINVLEDLIEQKMATINAELNKLELTCVTLDQCLRQLYERTQTMSDMKLQRFLHQILLAPGCPIAHCPRKISISRKAADNFVKFILEKFDELKDSLSCTYHLALDIDYIKNMISAHGSEIVTSHLLYKKKEPNVIFYVLNAILGQPQIPRELSLSVSNVINYFNSNLAPTYIHIYHLNNILNQLQLLALDENVKKKILTIMESLEVRAPEINLLLLQTPVNCTNYRSCLISLYLRLLKEHKSGLVQYLIEMFAPLGCNTDICPWLGDFPTKNVEQVKLELVNLIASYDSGFLPFQLRADFNLIKSIIINEPLDDIFGILGVQGNVNLLSFLEALGPNVLMKYDGLESQKNIISYITKSTIPNKLALNGLRALNEMFYNLTTDSLIRNDILMATNDLDVYNVNVKLFLNKLSLNCTDLSVCIEGIYDNLQMYKNDPMSVIVKNILFPQSCTKMTCPWILEESIEISLQKLRNIKGSITQLVESGSLPLIINIELDLIKSTLKLENTKELLPKVDIRKENFLIDFLHEMYRYPHVAEEERVELNNLIAYFTSGIIPDKVSLKDYNGLVRTIKKLSDDILVIFELTQIEKKAERYPKIMENILSNCPVECVKLNSCIDTLKNCLLKIMSPYAKIMLEQICPLKSQDERCTQVDYTKQTLLFPGKFFYPNQLIFFINIDNKLRSVSLDLTDPGTLYVLSNLPPIETFNSQIAMLEFKDGSGSNRRITIDLNNRYVLEKILNINQNPRPPTIDFSQSGATVVYVPTENGKLVPLKLDHSLPIVREGLKHLVRHQVHQLELGPQLTIVDFDGSTRVLNIDINNNALWKSLMKISSDTIHIDSLFVLLFPGKYGNSWRSLLVTDYDRHAIMILQNLPTFDEVNTVESVLGVTGGMIQLCFNVFDSWVSSTLKGLSKTGSRVPIIQTQETNSFLLGVPDRMGNLVPLRIDLNDSRYAEALVKVSQQLTCTTGCQPTFVLQTLTESIPIHLNFDNPLGLHILMEELKAVDKMEIQTHHKIIVIQDKNTKEYIILMPENYLVCEWLEDLSRVPDPSGDRLNIKAQDGSYEIQASINRNNPLVMQYLKQLMDKTLVQIPPTEVVADDGRRYLAMTIRSNRTGKLIPVVVELNPNNIMLLQGISQPYNTAAFEISIDHSITIKLLPNDPNVLEILPMLKQSEMLGIATVANEPNSNNGDLVVIPITTENGKNKILFFETRKPHVYQEIKETCNDTNGRSVVLTRPTDGQMEVVYCNLTMENEWRLKRSAGRERERLKPESTVIMTIPDKTGLLHPFILDLSNPNVLSKLRYFTSRANPTSENKIAIDYVDPNENTEVFIIDLNQVTIEDIALLSYETPSSMVAIQKLFKDNKLIVTTYPQEDGTVGHLILNISDTRTQEILSSISDPANPMATKIGIESTYGKIDVFVDFDNPKHMEAFRELGQLAPLIPAPLLIKRPQGLLKYTMIDEYGRNQIVYLNVTEQSFLENPNTNPLKPRISVIDSEGNLKVVSIDIEEGHNQNIGMSVYKPDKNTIAVIGVENERAIVLDLSQPEIREILKSLDTRNPNHMRLMLPGIGNQRFPVYIDTKDERTLILLRESQMNNAPNLNPTVVPTFESKHLYLLLTIQVDDKKTMPIMIDNQDQSTIKRLIEISDKSNPSSKLITITDSNGMSYPLYLDLTNINTQQILINASDSIKLPSQILMNVDDRVERYLELPMGQNRFSKCDLTNRDILNGLIQVSNEYRSAMYGVTTISVLNPETREGIVLQLDLESEQSIERINRICEGNVYLNPNPLSTMVIHVEGNEGVQRPVVINLETESALEMFENLGEIRPSPGRETLVQFQTPDNNLKVFKVDFQNPRAIEILQNYTGRPEMIAPTVLNNQKALVLSVMDDKQTPRTLYISLENQKVFSTLREMSNQRDINATQIKLTDSNGNKQVYYLNLENRDVVEALSILSSEFVTDKNTISTLPATNALAETSIAAMDSKGRVVVYTLNLTNQWVLNTINDLNVVNIDQFNKPTVSIAVPTENGTKLVHLDVNNEKISTILESISMKREFKPNPGDLIVLPTGVGNNTIVLDIANEVVIQTLIEISQETTIHKATHMFVIIDKDRNSQLIKVDLSDSKVMGMLASLQKQVSNSISPTQIFGPDQKSYLAFSVDSQAFVLDILDANVQNVLRQVAVDNPKKPFEMVYKTIDGRTETLVLDRGSDMFLTTLGRAQEITLLPKTTLKNSMTDALQQKLQIPVVQENGNLLQYTFDVTNTDIVNKLMHLSNNNPQTPSITVYINEQHSPIRLDVTDQNVLENLQLIAEDISAAYTFKTAMVFVVEVNNTREFIILDKGDRRMVASFIESFSQIYTLTTKGSIVNMIDDDGNTIEIKLDFTDTKTILILKELQNRFTPKVIKPFTIKIPNYQLPLLVFSLKYNATFSRIILDLNNPEVLHQLRRLNRTDSNTSYYTVHLQNREVIHLNVEDYQTIDVLIQLSQLTNAQDTAILMPTTEFVFTMFDSDLNLVKIHLDTKDQLVLQELIDISKSAPHDCTFCYNALITDVYGSTISVKIDTRNPEMIMKLIDLGKRFIYPKSFKVIPNTGYIPLQVFDIPINSFSFPITIDCNNATVLNRINQQSHGLKLKPGSVPIKIMACEQKGVQPILIDFEDKNLPVFLTGLSVLSPVILNPIVIIIKPNQQPLLNMLIETDYGQAAVTIDLNDDLVISSLLQVAIQSEPRVDVTTFFYVQNNVKVPLYLDLKDHRTLMVLKEITNRATIKLIPVIYKQPILMITLSDSRVIKLDLSNDVVTGELLTTGSKQIMTENQSNLIYIEIPSKYHLPYLIYLDLYDETTIDRLIYLSKFTPPAEALVLPNRKHKVNLPNSIIHGTSMLFPIVNFYILDQGPICIDLNQPEVMQLAMQFTQGQEPENPTYVMIPHVSGDIYILRLDLFDTNTLNDLRKMTKYCTVYYEPVDEVNLNPFVIAINLPKKVIHLDLNRTDVLETLKTISQTIKTEQLYSIYFPQAPGGYVNYNIDITDTKTQETLYILERPKLDPFLFELKYQDLDLSVWRIVIDVNSYEIMDQLFYFSENSTQTLRGDSTQTISLKLMSPQGRQFDVKLDKTNPQTLQILKELTLKSTGAESELLIKPKPKNLQYITITDRSGKPHQVAIDVNNLSVLRKLQQIVDSQENGPKTSVMIKMPDGSSRQIQIDVSDSATIENLLKLSIESERGIPAQLVRIKPPKKVIPTLMSFPITAPYIGSFTVTVDVGKIDIVQRLRSLAAEFVPGRSEVELTVRDREGQEILLKLDLTNSATLYKLVMLTIDSTGHNPTGIDPIEILNHVIYVPDLITVEIPDGYEILPMSFDRSLSQVVEALKTLPQDTTGRASSWELIDNKNLVIVTIDSTTVQAQTVIRSVGIQTLVPKDLQRDRIQLTEKNQLLGLFFLKIQGSLNPILLDLSKIETVYAIMKLVRNSYPTENMAYFEIRDCYSQFVTVGLDLNNHTIIRELESLSIKSNPIVINAKRVPYVEICTLYRASYTCVIMKMKLAILDILARSSDGVPIQILDPLGTNRDLYINPQDDSLIDALTQTEHAAIIRQPITYNLMIIYSLQFDDVIPIYVDLTSPKILELLNEIDSSYSLPQPLGIISYSRENVRSYFTVSVDDQLINFLSKDTAIASGHSIIRQKAWQKTTINVPSSDGNTIAISLDMADKETVSALKELSKNYRGVGSPTVINLEDAYGFPFQLLLDVYDEKTIGNLIRLSNKQHII